MMMTPGKYVLVDLARRVEVTFHVPGVGPTKETYDLGYAEHLLAWSLNERISRAVQTGVRVVETVKVPAWKFRHAMRSRAGMKPFIDHRISEAGQRAARGAAGGQ